MATDIFLIGNFPENTVLIIGAGRFGGRAARILGPSLKSPLWLLDVNREALARVDAPAVSKVRDDGIRFLAENMALLKPTNVIVPSIPRHLAFEWVKACIGRPGATPIPVPQEIQSLFPHAWMSPEGSLLVSYANFLCPEDCEEPETHCTVTGEPRGVPLYERLTRLEVKGYRMHIIRSRQLAPGVGGYPVSDLNALMGRLRSLPGEKWLIGTACRCHGTVSALSVQVS
ncbi:MAG: hypothetical protein AB1512_06255 [Thermodesulfobacteriota bacterium]